VIKANKQKAQSFLEYSLLIAVGVVALIVMQYYFGRGAMGLLKQNVDNLGGEKITSTQFSPGKWYGSKGVTRISSSGFDYEGRKGFGVSFGKTQRSSVGKIINAVQASELVPEDVEIESNINGEETALLNQAENSGFDPNAGEVQANVEQNMAQWHNDSTETQELDENTGASTDRQAENIVNNYVDQSSVRVE
jgi:hypothetical protein